MYLLGIGCLFACWLFTPAHSMADVQELGKDARLLHPPSPDRRSEGINRPTVYSLRPAHLLGISVLPTVPGGWLHVPLAKFG